VKADSPTIKEENDLQIGLALKSGQKNRYTKKHSQLLDSLIKIIQKNVNKKIETPKNAQNANTKLFQKKIYEKKYLLKFAKQNEFTTLKF
jgi:hypothetical protein